MLVPNRHGSSNSYRYGFNGKEKDDELKGQGNHIDYGMRTYDPRVGKFLSLDPLSPSYPNLTPYQYASNSPIANIDLDGLESLYFQITHDKDTGVATIKLVDIKTSYLDKVLPYHIVISIDGSKYMYAGDYALSFEGQREELSKDLQEYAKNPQAAIQKFTQMEADAKVAAQEQKEFIQNLFVAGFSVGWVTKIKTNTAKNNATENKKTPVEKKSVTVRRVQTAHKDSQRIIIDKDGNVDIQGSNKLYITLDDKNHATYYYNKKGGSEGSATIVTFEIKKDVADEIRKMAVPQAQAKQYPNRPEISDPTKSNGAYGLPSDYIEKLEKAAIKGSGKIEKPK